MEHQVRRPQIWGGMVQIWTKPIRTDMDSRDEAPARNFRYPDMFKPYLGKAAEYICIPKKVLNVHLFADKSMSGSGNGQFRNGHTPRSISRSVSQSVSQLLHFSIGNRKSR